MLVTTQWDEKTLMVLLSGRFDKTARVPMETALAEAEDRPCNQVILDFSGVSSLDSAGIGKLLLLYHSFRKRGVALTVMNPRSSIANLLQMVNLATVIPIVQQKREVRFVA